MEPTKLLGTLAHILIAVMLQLAFEPYGGAAAVAVFFGRELAQAEYRYIEENGGKRYECPWYCGFLPSAWTVKGLLDWLLPLFAVYAVPYLQKIVLSR